MRSGFISWWTRQKAGCSDEEIARLCDIAMCGDHGIGKCLAFDYFNENQISFEWIVDEGGAVIRFAPIDIDKQQYASVHGENENISVEEIHLMVDFYRKLIGKYK